MPCIARALELIVLGLTSTALSSAAHAQTAYETLNYGTSSTFLTGIRGDNIVGNYVIPGTTETGGIYYNLATKTWSPLPEATENGANFPGAIGSSPYGPNFGSPSGILRVVGSYQTAASAPYDLSYLVRRRRGAGSADHQAGLSEHGGATDPVHHRPQHLRPPGRRQLRHRSGDRQRLHLRHQTPAPTQPTIFPAPSAPRPTASMAT